MQDQKEDFQISVSNEEVSEHARNLLDLTSARVEVTMREEIPDEALEFIGRERAEMARRLEAVMQLNFKIFDVVTSRDPLNEIPLQKLNGHISSVVSASQDPGESMRLVSRIWRYLDDNTKMPYDPKIYRISPASLASEQAKHARSSGIEPLSDDEKHKLFPAIRDWKLGKKPEDILKGLDYSLDYALRKAYPKSREARLIARYRGEDRMGLGRRAGNLQDIRNFLAALFQGQKEESNRQK